MSDKGYPEGGSHHPTNLPYVRHSESDYYPMRMGGTVRQGMAASALLIGDVVYLSAVDTWAKSNAFANYTGLVGIVVGGDNTYMDIVQTDNVIGTPACATGGNVVVMTYGICKALSDAALATVNSILTVGATTAGRIGTANAATGNIVGVQLDTATAAAQPIRVFVGARR